MKHESSLESLTNLLLPLFLILGLVLLLSSGQAIQTVQSVTPLESWLKVIVGYLAAVAEMTGALASEDQASVPDRGFILCAVRQIPAPIAIHPYETPASCANRGQAAFALPDGSHPTPPPVSKVTL